MQDIDFLPADFKRRRTNRHGRSWLLFVVVAAVGLVCVVAICQNRALRQVEKRLAEIEPERQQINATQIQLAELRKQLAATEAQADLIAYMRYPWPKTQLLASVLRCLPDEVVFDRVRIAQENRSGERQRRRGGDAAEEDLEKLEPAERDLRLLQEECDHAVVAATLEGMTTDGISLHRYLYRLNDAPLLDKVELHSLESTNEDTGAKFRFEARLTARPGFGQPHGPDGRSLQVAKANPDEAEVLP